jgi:hypothetical protein
MHAFTPAQATMFGVSTSPRRENGCRNVAVTAGIAVYGPLSTGSHGHGSGRLSPSSPSRIGQQTSRPRGWRTAGVRTSEPRSALAGRPMGLQERAWWRGPRNRLRCCSSCCTLCCMDTLSRKTINFDHADTPVVAPFLDENSAEHAALEQIVGERLASDSAELRALVLLGVRRVHDALLEDAYNQAVDAGDFDDTRTWAEQTTSARRRRRASA